MNLWIGRRGVVMDFCDIYCIEQVMIVVVIVVYIDFIFFCQNVVYFFIW